MQRFLMVTAVLVTALVPQTVSAADEGPVDFDRHIQPLLTRYGCNSGACHGKQRGQNGFQLSLFGFDSDFDQAALAKEARGRRVSITRPEESLALLKATGSVPHGGGIRFKADSPEAALFRRWIAEGATRAVPGTPKLERVSLAETSHRFAPKESRDLKVTAHYSDGSTADITQLATYQSSESPIAAVDENGRVTASGVVGEATIMARFLGEFVLYNVSVPLEGDVPAEYYASLPRNNFIDEHIWAGLARLGLKAADPAPDHKFLRRATIDIIGRLPTADEAGAFLDDTSADRREKLVDRLLNSPEYAEHWANKWADLLRPNPYRVGIKATFNFDGWIRDSFRKNKPYDQFVRELLTAQGSTFRHGQTTLFRDRREPDELTTVVSQLFLGIRLECAKCHHHPFEVYGQEDFYSFAAYFAKLSRKGTALSPPISGSEEILFSGTRGEVRHPLTNEVLPPRPLFGTSREIAEGEDPRVVLAEWMTSPDNPYFAQTMANRIWADLMGRGLVEPVDDLRKTNPPVNAELLEALGKEFAGHGFDIKHLIRTIVLSRAYSLSSVPNERNLVDTRAHSRYYRSRLRAEVLLDSVARITNMPESFGAMAPGSQARELWTHRITSLFLDAYGRPDPNQDPPCERVGDPTVVQTLHLMNSGDLYDKVTAKAGKAAVLAQSDRPPAEIVEELYLSIYSRKPTEEELRIGIGLYENTESGRQTPTEDLMWALMNTPEFVLKD